jgi:hypothetical protein
MARQTDELPLPSARGRSVSPDAARVRGVPSTPSSPATQVFASPASAVAERVAADPALEQLRSRKVKRTGLNVHINSQVHTAFAAFIDEYELPKGDATSLAIQEFLERRGVVIPGVARVLPPPMTVVPDEVSHGDNGGDTTAHG